MTSGGVFASPGGTLVDRTLAFLDAGPADSETLARDVLGLARTSPTIADRVVVALLGSDPRVRQLADSRWTLAAGREGAKVLADCTFAVVDVETTGTRAAKGDRVIEVAVVTLSRGVVDVVFESLVNPGRPVPRYVAALTRITGEMLEDQPNFDDIADPLLAALAGRIFAAHNAQFDWRFLTGELRRVKGLELDGPKVCTLRLARRLLPELRSRGLDALTAYFGITIAGRHRAGGDAVATAHLLYKLLELAGERGATTVDDLEQLAGRRRRGRTALPVSMAES